MQCNILNIFAVKMNMGNHIGKPVMHPLILFASGKGSNVQAVID
jgi:hypothetical protein